MYWLLYIAVGAVVTAWLAWRITHRRLIRMVEKIPGPPTLPVLGNALRFMCKPQEFINELLHLRAEYGDVFRVWLGFDVNVLVSDPDDIRTLLISQKTTAKGPQYKYIADVAGEGILTGSGPKWRRHRKLATPHYTKRAVDNYTGVINQETALFLETLRTKNKQLINVYKDIVWCTSLVVCQSLMGLTRTQALKLPRFEYVIYESQSNYKIIFDRMTKWYLQIEPVFWMTNLHGIIQEYKKSVIVMCDAIAKNSSQKLKALDAKYLESMNLKTDSESNSELSVVDTFILSQELSKKEVNGEIYTLFTSSQEASAKIASYLILMMAYHAKYQEKLYAEIFNVIGDGNQPITDQQLKDMPYLDMVFKEVIRLFPIGCMLQRTVIEDIEISSYTLPAGCSLVVPIYQMHRDPRFWTNPDSFEPERFSSENVKTRNPNCYIPFSLGPMDCLGRYFGTKLIKTICIRLLSEFEVTTPYKYENMRLAFAISVSSIDGFPVVLHPRNKNASS